MSKAANYLKKFLNSVNVVRFMSDNAALSNALSPVTRIALLALVNANKYASSGSGHSGYGAGATAISVNNVIDSIMWPISCKIYFLNFGRAITSLSSSRSSGHTNVFLDDVRI
nr:hypothetical protein [Taibaiella soli]